MAKSVNPDRSSTQIECQAQPNRRDCSSCTALANHLIRKTLQDSGIPKQRAGILTEGVLASVSTTVDGTFPASKVASLEFPGLVSCESRRAQVAETAVELATRTAEQTNKG